MNDWNEFVERVYDKYNLRENQTAMKYKASLSEYHDLINIDFNVVYDKVNNYMLKDGKITDQIKNMNSVMRNESKNSMRQSYYTIQEDYKNTIDLQDEASVIYHYDRVKKEPYFRWIHYYLGNGALGAAFNKQLRDVIMMSGTQQNFKHACKVILRKSKLFHDSQTDVSDMLNDIHNLDKAILNDLLVSNYSDTTDQTVNTIRKEILRKIIDGETVNSSDIDDIILDLKNSGIHNWKSFSLLVGLYYKLFDIEKYENIVSSHIFDLVDKISALDNFKYSKVFNLMGSMKQGATVFSQSFMKSRFKANSTNQICFMIGEVVSIYFFDNANNNKTAKTIIDLDSDTLDSDITKALIKAHESFHDNSENSKSSENQGNYWVARVPDEAVLEKMKQIGMYQIHFNELNVGDLLKYKSIEEVSEGNQNFYNKTGSLKMNDRQALWDFSHEIMPGDNLIIVVGNHQVLSLAKVTGEYQYDPATNAHNIPVVFNSTMKGVVKERFVQKTLTNITEYGDYVKGILKQLQSQIELEFNKEDFTNDYKQLIIDGAPGTGKSYKVNEEIGDNGINHERVTFYQDYEYHNFVGSILPTLDDNKTISYEFNMGPFSKILNDALSNPTSKHYLVIEELTRGNAPAIFGDIFQLLDRDDKGWSQYPITNDSILKELDVKAEKFLKNSFDCKVVLPPNLSIICTINSSDQNVYPLDTAFKRRFDYEIKSTEVNDDFEDFEIKLGVEITMLWSKFYTSLNMYILKDLGLKEDKQLGPYFIKNPSGEEKGIKSIQTKLAMYMWNDLHKVHTISSKTLFDSKEVHTLYDVDKLLRTGSKEEVLKILSDDFIKVLELEDANDH